MCVPCVGNYNDSFRSHCYYRCCCCGQQEVDLDKVPLLRTFHQWWWFPRFFSDDIWRFCQLQVSNSNLSTNSSTLVKVVYLLILCPKIMLIYWDRGYPILPADLNFLNFLHKAKLAMQFSINSNIWLSFFG